MSDDLIEVRKLRKVMICVTISAAVVALTAAAGYLLTGEAWMIGIFIAALLAGFAGQGWFIWRLWALRRAS